MTGFLNAVHHPFTIHLILGAAKRDKTNFCHNHSSGNSSASNSIPFKARRIVP